MGDGLLAYFGWPKAHEDDAERAVRAGLAITKAVPKLTTPAKETLAARVGIATGLVVVGDLVGEGSSQEEAVVGETPNLAARLQAGLAEAGGVVVAEPTRRLLGEGFDLADLGVRELKGFAAPVRSWRVIGDRPVKSRFEAAHPTAMTQLISRQHELSLLLDRWTEAKAGEGQVVLLSGEPGIGKSRITQAFRERIAGEPHKRLRYQCSPYHTNSALYPVIGQLEFAAGLSLDDPPERKLEKLEVLLAQAIGDVAPVAPLMAALLSIPFNDRYAPLDLTPQMQKSTTLEALLAQLTGLAARQPLLMIMEDAHWIDPTTKELFGLMIERVESLPVLLVITFRPGFTPPWGRHARHRARAQSPVAPALFGDGRGDNGGQGAAGRGHGPDRRQDRWRAALRRRADEDAARIRGLETGGRPIRADRPAAVGGDSRHAPGLAHGAPRPARLRQRRRPDRGGDRPGVLL
jgi:hypothetical protein